MSYVKEGWIINFCFIKLFIILNGFFCILLLEYISSFLEFFYEVWIKGIDILLLMNCFYLCIMNIDW